MNTAPGSTKSVLGSDIEIKGSLKFSGDLTFEGKIEGEIRSDGTLHLGESSSVNGDISVNAVVLRGKIKGNVVAKDRIEIKDKTELFGDIKAAKLVVEEGATFVGKTEVNPNKLTPTPGPAGKGGESSKTAERGKASSK